MTNSAITMNMIGMETPVSHRSDVTKRVYRNYLQTPQTPRIWSLTAFNPFDVGNSTYVKNAAERNSERSRRYRFNLVNAIHTVKQLAGDDLSVLESDNQ